MSAQTIFMVRIKVADVANSFRDIWFSDRAEMDGFLARRQPEIIVADIHERVTHTWKSALAGVDEHIAEVRAEQ